MKSIILFFLFCAFATPVNAILNGSFELPVIPDGTSYPVPGIEVPALDNWTVFGNVWLVNPSPAAFPQPVNGDNYVELFFESGNYTFISQNIPVSPGTFYTFETEALRYTSSDPGGSSSIILADGANVLASYSFSWVDLNPDEWTTITLAWNSTGYGGSSVDFIIDVASVSGGLDADPISSSSDSPSIGAGIAFDDVKVIPEPATIALLALGGLLMRKPRA